MVFHGPGDLRWEDLPVPAPADGELVMRIDAALTCGTDVKTLRRGHPVMIPKVPTVFGHEFARAIAWSPATRRRAGAARRAWPDGRISAKTCYSSTAPTASSSCCRRAW